MNPKNMQKCQAHSRCSVTLSYVMEYVRDELNRVGHTTEGLVLAKIEPPRSIIHELLLKARCQCSDSGEYLRQWTVSMNPTWTFQDKGSMCFLRL